MPSTATKCWRSKFPNEVSVDLRTQSVETDVKKYLQSNVMGAKMEEYFALGAKK